MTNLALQDIQNDLHISNSQIGTYQSCSLKYYYHYVEKRQSETSGIALFFGSAIHSALDLYYSSCKIGKTEPLEAVIEAFNNCLKLDLKNSEVPVAYNKSMPDENSAINTGKSLLEVFYESVDLSGYEVVGVEMPLSAPLYTDEGEVTDFQLVGIIDLLLRKQNEGGYLIVDNKTAAKSMSPVIGRRRHPDDGLQLPSGLQQVHLPDQRRGVQVRCSLETQEAPNATSHDLQDQRRPEKVREDRQDGPGRYRQTYLLPSDLMDVAVVAATLKPAPTGR